MKVNRERDVVGGESEEACPVRLDAKERLVCERKGGREGVGKEKEREGKGEKRDTMAHTSLALHFALCMTVIKFIPDGMTTSDETDSTKPSSKSSQHQL